MPCFSPHRSASWNEHLLTLKYSLNPGGSNVKWLQDGGLEGLLLKLNSDSNGVWMMTGRTGSLWSPAQARLSNSGLLRQGSWTWPEHIPCLHVWGDSHPLGGSEGQEATFHHAARPKGSQG